MQPGGKITELAEMLGVDIQTIFNWEVRNIKPTSEKIIEKIVVF